jgi:hypothetical protein
MASSEIRGEGGREQALREIAALAERHGLTTADISVALGGAPAAAAGSGRARGVLVRVLGALGGTFVFAGVGVFIAVQWSEMNSAARIVVTLGSGLAAFVLALLSDRDTRFARATTPLLLMAAALEPTGMLVMFDELGPGGDWRWAGLVTAGSMALQFGAGFRILGASTPLFLTILFAALFSWTALDLMGMDAKIVAMTVGASLLLAAAGIERTRYRGVTPLWFFLGGAAFLGGLFDLVDRTPFELAFLVVAAGFVYLSVVWHSRTLLGVATAGILAYTAWFTGQYFADSVGWPLALIVFGLLMIGLSSLALRIDRDYVRAH